MALLSFSPSWAPGLGVQAQRSTVVDRKPFPAARYVHDMGLLAVAYCGLVMAKLVSRNLFKISIM